MQRNTDSLLNPIEHLSQELRNIWYALDESAIVAVTDRRGVITHVNRKFCEISGYDHTELIGRTHRLINSEFHPPAFFSDLWKTILAGKIWEGEIRNASRTGKIYWVHTTIVPFLNDEGQPLQFVSIRYDITGQKQTQEKLRYYAEELEGANARLKERELAVQSLLDSTFEGILVHDENGRLLEWNRAAESVLCASLNSDSHLEQFLGKEGWNAWHTLASDRAPTAATGSGSKEIEVPLVERLRGQDGSPGTLQLEIATKRHPFEGRLVWLTSVRDISTRKQMESQIITQDRLASIGLLASSLAHEIGTPLGVIRGRAEIMAMNQSSDPGVIRSTEVITAQIDRVSKLIRNLLTLARGDSGGAPIAVMLGKTVAEVAELMAHEFKRRSIEVRIDPGVSQAKVVANPEALQQVILNLFMNSLHAIEAAQKVGRIQGHSVRVSVKERASWVDIMVEDSGVGISKANMTQLFKPFFTTKDVGKGTGLGLATCFRMVQSWGGTMRAESEEGRFARFIVSLQKPTSEGP